MDLIIERAKTWLANDFDADTRKQVQYLLDNDHKLLTESFYQDLEFGTGGMRGIMGVGTNRMNKYTIGMTTQGLCNYLIKNFPNEQIKCAIAYDCRNNSKEFAITTASVFSANNIQVFLFDTLRPTPELSFTIRQLNCHSGVVITASHNPKEYNGYKVYWKDGGQIINPHDTGIIAEVRKINNIKEVKFDESLKNITIIGEDIDKDYINQLSKICLNPDIIKNSDLNIVFTPLHGSTVTVLQSALKHVGFKNIYLINEQATPDGNFPTVNSPNPEDPAAFDIALKTAKEVNGDIIIGTDPDGDRIGVVVKHNNEYVFLNGNQTASILIYYIIDNLKKQNKLKGNEFIVKTIVTTDLISHIAADYKIKHYDVLTGFKYIAALIEENYPENKFIGGGEESYGFLASDIVRDKDAVMTSLLISEIAASAKLENKTLIDILFDIYIKYEYYYESLKSITKSGKSGLEEIDRMMTTYRDNTPTNIAGIKTHKVYDYEKSQITDLTNGQIQPISLPKSNVIQLELEDKTKITIRPSGTEPKIKFYISLQDKLENVNNYKSKTIAFKEKMKTIFDELDKIV